LDNETPEAAEVVTPDAPVEGQAVDPAPSPVDGDSTPAPSAREIELSEKFNQITAREKDLRDAEARIKDERETMGVTASEHEETRKILETFKDNPLAGLKALGIEFKDVAERVINDGEPTAEHRVAKLEREWIAKRDADQAASDTAAKAQEESHKKLQAEAKERAVAQTQKDIAVVIKDGGDKYEMIRAQGAESLVFDVAAQVYRDTKKIMTWDEAADQVEKQITAEVEKFLETGKFKAKYQLRPEKVVMSEEEEEEEGSNFYARRMLNEKYGRILDNTMTGSSGSNSGTSEKSVSPEKWLSDEESKDHLAKRLKAMLGS
jgi:hypothetical protein